MVDVSVIGCGNMGGALVRGLVLAGHEDVLVCDVDPSALDRVSSLGVDVSTDPADAVDSEIVFLAVKPELVGPILQDLDLTADQTVVSIAAGVATEFIIERTEATVVRIMPNLAAEWGSMACAVTGESIDEELWTMLSDLGAVVEIDERLMDTATAVNGSGPAFVFYLIKAMAEAGVDRGLDPDDARILAAQTFKGAAETVLRSEDSLDSLIDAVCSPNGTTIEGMAVLEASDIERTIAEAVTAAERRGAELSREVAHE